AGGRGGEVGRTCRQHPRREHAPPAGQGTRRDRHAHRRGAAMTAMTATAAPTRARSRGALTGTGTLLRFMLRRDRIRLPVSLIAISIFVPYFFSAFEQLFPTQADLAQMASFTSDRKSVV